MWRDILKVQILDTVTDLNIDMEPMVEDKDCCEEALKKFVDLYPDVMSIRKWTCERLRRFLGQNLDWDNIEVAEDYLIFINKERQILKEWEECENE